MGEAAFAVAVDVAGTDHVSGDQSALLRVRVGKRVLQFQPTYSSQGRLRSPEQQACLERLRHRRLDFDV